MQHTSRIAPPFALTLVACGNLASLDHVPGVADGSIDAPPWQPVDPASLLNSCGAPLDPAPPAPRASSLRPGPCDFGETLDSTTYDLLCADGNSCAATQTGDQLCHRICDDHACATGEVCQSRPVYVSDTPTRFANLCMCAGGPCAENPSPPSPAPAEGGLRAWRDEAPMPVDLYDHAAAADGAHLFVSGGIHITQRDPNGSATGESMSAVYVADLDPTGVVTAWRQAGDLPAPVVDHAMAAVGGRLYVAGGSVENPLQAPAFSDAVFSYAIGADGSLGPARAEAALPSQRGYHVLLVDPGSETRIRLVVASGSTDASYLTSTSEIDVAPISSDGTVGSWSSITGPDGVYFDHAAGLSAGGLYVFVAGAFQDASARGLYGVRLTDLVPGAPASAFVRSVAWARDPAALSADENVRLAGSCTTLVFIGTSGAVGTAPVDAAARVGAFRPGSRFGGASSDYAVATSPSGRIYVTGGFAGTSADGSAVRSTQAW
jgi:hypothetical protein